MKTPEEIIAERLGESFSERRPANHSIIKDCMKEYAKQWVDRTAYQLNVAPRWDLCVEWLKKDIDAQ